MRAPLDPDDVARFRDLVREQVGLAFPQSRLADVERAVHKAVAETALPDAGALYRLLTSRARPQEALDALVSALNVGETHFLRDQAQIRALEERILPEIIVRRRPGRRLRVWSAACSTGEEAYTLAILVRQQLPDLAEWDVRILATDVNGRALERARRGVYGPWSFRGVPPHVKHAYFVRHGTRYRVVPHIRAMVTFEQTNLVDGAPLRPPADPWKTDLILCRNVLQYFDGSTARAVVGRLVTCLDDHGWILLSQVEAALGGFDGLDAQGGGAFRKAPPVPAETRLPGAPPHRHPPPPRPGPAPRPPGPLAHRRRHQLPRRRRGRRRATGRPSGCGGGSPAGRAAPAAARRVPRPARRSAPLPPGPDPARPGARRPGAGGVPPLHVRRPGLRAGPPRAGQPAHARREPQPGDGGAGQRGRLVADLDPEARVFPEDELRAGALLELVDAQRQLLRPRSAPEVVDG